MAVFLGNDCRKQVFAVQNNVEKKFRSCLLVEFTRVSWYICPDNNGCLNENMGVWNDGT